MDRLKPKVKSFLLSRSRSRSKSRDQNPQNPSANAASGASAPSSFTSNSLWMKALEDVSSEDKEIILGCMTLDQAGNEDLPMVVWRIVEDKRQLCESRRWTFRCGKYNFELKDAAGKVMEWVEKFISVGDMVAELELTHAKLPWAGMKFLLEVAASERNEMEALLRGLNRVLYVMYRCRLYELFLQKSSGQAHDNLQLALVALYSFTLTFLAKAAKTYQKSTVQRALAAFWTAGEMQDFENQCKDLETRADIEAQNFQTIEVLTIHKTLRELPKMEELKDSIDYINSAVTNIWKSLQDNEASNILTWISGIPYLDHHKDARKGHTPETGMWIFTHPEYSEWESSKSAVLWLHGIPGAGKTKLVSQVIEQTSQQAGVTMAYFYCSRGDDSRRKSSSILQSYIKQLARSHGNAIHQAIVDVYTNNKANGRPSLELSVEECENLLLELVKSLSNTILILDALDEIPIEERESFLASLDRLVTQSESLKILISSRDDDDIEFHLESKFDISINAFDNGDDIGKFVGEKLKAMQQKRRKPIPKDLEEEILCTLQKKSQGMFQWAALQVHQLSYLDLENEIHDRLGRLPSTLKESYDEIIQEIQSSGRIRYEIAFRAFQYILFSFKALSEQNLVSFVRRDPKTGRVQHSDMDIHVVLKVCRNLLVIRNTDRCEFSHLSIREYLEEHHCDKKGLNLSDSAHTAMATVTIRCLLDYIPDNYGMICKGPVLAAWAPEFTYAAHNWYRHARESLDEGVFRQSIDLYNEIFSPHSVESYNMWLSCIHSMPLLDGFNQACRLQTASRLNLEFAVDKILEECAGVDVSEAITTAARCCHMRILRKLLQFSPEISTTSLCKIVISISEDITDTMAILMEKDTFYDQSQSNTRRIHEDIALAAAYNTEGYKIWEIFFEANSTDFFVTQNLVEKAARRWQYGVDMLGNLLTSNKDQLGITKELLHSALRNFLIGDQLVLKLLEIYGDDVPLTADGLKIAASNGGCGHKIFKAIFDSGKTDLEITEDIVQASLENQMQNDNIISILLDQYGRSLPITTNIVKTAIVNRNDRPLSMILQRRLDIPITEDLLKQIAEKAYNADVLIKRMIEWRGSEVVITQGVLMAASRNRYCRHRLIKVIQER